jgi:hypothetical protein
MNNINLVKINHYYFHYASADKINNNIVVLPLHSLKGY